MLTSLRIGRPFHAGHLAENWSDTLYENAHNFLFRSQIETKLMALKTRLKEISLQWLHDRFWNFYLGPKGPNISGLKTNWFQTNFCRNFKSSYLLTHNSKSVDSLFYGKLIKYTLLWMCRLYILLTYICPEIQKPQLP